jgi:hypothetical protein
MGIIEAVIILLVATGAGYQTGKVVQRVEAYREKEICFDEYTAGLVPEGCYELKKVKTEPE